MNKLQKRRQQHKRRQEQLTLLRRAGCSVLAALLLFCLLQLPATTAYFTDQAEVPPATFRATTFADNLVLAPGKSKTNDSPGNPAPAFKVATIVNGQLHLDFGTYPAGNNRNFPQVLVAANIGDRLLTLDWHFCGVLAPFFEHGGSLSIAPGVKATLMFKLDTSPGDVPGEYQGTLYISALDGFIIAEIPARLRLAAPPVSKKKIQEDTVSDKVYETVYENPKPGGRTDKTEQQLTDETVFTEEQAGGGPAVPDVNDKENALQGLNNMSVGADGKTAEAGKLNEQVQPKQEDASVKTQVNGSVYPADKVDGGGSSDGNSTDSGS